MVDFFKISVVSRINNILFKSNVWLGMYVLYMLKNFHQTTLQLYVFMVNSLASPFFLTFHTKFIKRSHRLDLHATDYIIFIFFAIT